MNINVRIFLDYLNMPIETFKFMSIKKENAQRCYDFLTVIDNERKNHLPYKVLEYILKKKLK